MKIKRVFAQDMRSALRQVREEMGDDAVILSNKRVDGGIELVAAIDYDEAQVMQQAREQAPQANRAASRPQAFNQAAPAMAQPTASTPRHPEVPHFDEHSLDDVLKDDTVSFSSNKSVGSAKAKSSKVGLTSKLSDTVKRLAKSEPPKAAVKTRQQNHADSIQAQLNANSVNAQQATNKKLPFDYESLAEVSDQRQEPTAQPQKPARSVKQPKIEWSQDPALKEMREEIHMLRDMLEDQLSGLAWGNFANQHPHRPELMQRLSTLGVKASLSERILSDLRPAEHLEASWRQVLGTLAKNLPIMEEDILSQGGVIALVGPTGVGKTTTIAKLAARYTLQHGADEIALVTTDTYRVGAHEQLKTYGRILGIPVHIANDSNELRKKLEKLHEKRLVLVDTAGMSQRDMRLTEQLQMLRSSWPAMNVLGVFSAAAQTLSLDEVVKQFGEDALDGCILTKLDESSALGGALSVAIEHELPIAFTSDGQRVPEDLHVARANQLVKQALDLMQSYYQRNEDVAMAFAGGMVNAPI